MDHTRIAELFEVTAAPEGPERDRAVERVKRSQAELRITFGADSVTLESPGIERHQGYRVLSTYGPLVSLEGFNGTEVVNTTLKLDGDRLTWFDAAGEIEFVLRRQR